MIEKNIAYAVAISFLLNVESCFTASQPSSGSSGASSFFDSVPKQPPRDGQEGKPPVHILPKPILPPMLKPFGMPGVIGLNNGKWEGTDYLGYLNNHIGIDVEILSPEKVQVPIDSGALKRLVGTIFEKNYLIPQSDVKEGPLLPFLHVLVIVYPVAQGRYAVFAATRLFEQIQVIRKDFVPAGYWQGITWESQDTTLSSGTDLEVKIKEIVEKLAKGFADRYHQYNPNIGSMQPQGSTPRE